MHKNEEVSPMAEILCNDHDCYYNTKGICYCNSLVLVMSGPNLGKDNALICKSRRPYVTK